jgi:hypothetical protein
MQLIDRPTAHFLVITYHEAQNHLLLDNKVQYPVCYPCQLEFYHFCKYGVNKWARITNL